MGLRVKVSAFFADGTYILTSNAETGADDFKLSTVKELIKACGEQVEKGWQRQLQASRLTKKHRKAS